MDFTGLSVLALLVYVWIFSIFESEVGWHVSGDGNDGGDAHCCRALGSAIERGVRVCLRILVTRFRQKVLPGSGPGAI